MTRRPEPARPIVHKSKANTIRAKKSSEPRLCPTCWNVMRLLGDHWECPKHGKPDRP